MTVRAITFDFWGTLLFDPPSSDNRYKTRRMKDFEMILAGAGARVALPTLERAYEASGAYLGRVWADHRDVPVIEHVRAIVAAADAKLPARLSADVFAALVDAYARPVLMVPPAVDDGALKAVTVLFDRGYKLAVVSNTMRTPGATLRKLLERYGLLARFAHVVFSDEVGVRKPDPAIFLGALKALGAEAAAAIHVGDDTVLDVEGAHAAGMRAVLVGTAPVRARGARQPDAVVSRLGEVPEAIARLDVSPPL
ncbi:MAG TPA: HAD family hydrolase [Methylomirabilota bacterium]|nr:HAD family hydrolase [Methylomirabilota bacterium]